MSDVQQQQTTERHERVVANGDTGIADEAVITREVAAGVEGPLTRTPFHRGAPAAIGVPLFIVGSVALGLYLINYVPATGASIPIILAATGLGDLIAAVWSVALGESAVASIFGIFGGFWLSYGVLVLGLTHNWFGVVPTAVVHTEADFLIAWLAVIGLLTVSSLRLPVVFSAIFLLVELALALVLAGTLNATTDLIRAAGVVVFAFAGVGAWVYYDTMDRALGGKGVPLGPPLLT